MSPLLRDGGIIGLVISAMILVLGYFAPTPLGLLGTRSVTPRAGKGVTVQSVAGDETE